MTQRVSWPKRIAVALFAVPIAGFLNLILVCAVGSSLWLGFEAATGARMTGVITDAARHTVRSTKGPDERYCYGRFTADDHSVVNRRVHVYVNGYCVSARGSQAVLVQGLATPITRNISGPATSDPMAFNGLFGMTDGAVIDWRNFVTQLWPLIFLIPIALAADIVIVTALRRRIRRHRVRRTPGSATS